jgi:hypothetical protein
MKTVKSIKSEKRIIKIDSLQQFKDIYFPSLSVLKKTKAVSEGDEYGTTIAMSILDGIRKDLSTLRR